ncbi:UNVERIFIED_CONTAM: hypothetical protein GTU68_018931 [Idotea baltica]|nr:hypothetical protein [Idotea baltica]
MLPGLSAPPLLSALLMALSGVAWAIYSIKGQRSANALQDTAYNFIRTAPFVGILFIMTFDSAYASYQGMLLAIISGAVTSGLGYTIWYRALRDLTTTQAAVVQLMVPVIAGLGGVVFLAEAMSHRFIVASALILGGTLLVILGRYYWQAKSH